MLWLQHVAKAAAAAAPRCSLRPNLRSLVSSAASAGEALQATTAQPGKKREPVDISQLPNASVKLNFRSLPYTQEAMAITSIQPPLQQPSGEPFVPKEARRQIGLHPVHAPQAAAWACEYFTIRAMPPPYPEYRRTSRSPFSPFPDAEPRVSKRDFPTPPPALDKYLLQDPALSLDERVEIQHRQRHKIYTMDLTIIVSKKKVHKLAHVRNKIRTRLKGAIRLAVQHGVVYDATEGQYVQDKSGTAHWLLPGHMYVMHTTLEVCKLPGAELHERVCAGLQAVKGLGQSMLVERTAEAELDRAELAIASSASQNVLASPAATAHVSSGSSIT